MNDTWKAAVARKWIGEVNGETPPQRQKGIDDNDSWLDAEHLEANVVAAPQDSPCGADYLRCE